MVDRIHVPLELEGFEVDETKIVDGVLEVGVRCTRRPACHHCGSVAVTGHCRSTRRIRDRSCAYPTVLRWSQRRLKCSDCGRTCRERHPEIAERRAITKRFRRHLFERAIEQPFVHVARTEVVSSYRVEEAFEAHALQSLIEQPAVPPRVVSLDESAFRRGRRFHTVFSDPERGVVFDLVEGRHKGAALGGLLALDDQVRAGIESVVIDCHWPYRQAVEELLPQARLVADKFHIMRAVDEAAQRVRRRHGRRRMVKGRDGGITRQHNPRFDPRVFRSRWMFMRRSPRLSPSQRDGLFVIFEQFPEIGVAWLMKESFAAIYDAPDRNEAARRLDVWIGNLEAAAIPELDGVWRQMQWWRDQILNYFDDRITNGFAEGITNKIKVMKRTAYGFRDPVRYRQKVLLNCRRRPSRHA